MTRLLANVNDFKLIALNGEDRTYYFRFGHCEDFHVSFALFKQKISPMDRKTLPEKNWLWEVKASPHNYMVLADLFDNFAAEYEAAKSQLTLFG